MGELKDNELAREILFLREASSVDVPEKVIGQIVDLARQSGPREALDALPSRRDIRNRYETILKSRSELMELGRECPKCHHMTLVPIEIQRRRADEPSSLFDRCDNCGYQVFRGE